MTERGVYQQLRSHLAYLHLSAAAEQLALALEQAERTKPSYTRFLERLLSLEVEATERRRLEGRLRFASFPSPKTLAEIDYDAQPALDRKLVDELAAADRGLRAPLPGRLEAVRARLDHPHHQPWHRQLGRDLRRHHHRRSHPRPAPPPRHRAHHQRAQLPDAPPPQSNRAAPRRPPGLPSGAAKSRGRPSQA